MPGKGRLCTGNNLAEQTELRTRQDKLRQDYINMRFISKSDKAGLYGNYLFVIAYVYIHFMLVISMYLQISVSFIPEKEK